MEKMSWYAIVSLIVLVTAMVVSVAKRVWDSRRDPPGGGDTVLLTVSLPEAGKNAASDAEVEVLQSCAKYLGLSSDRETRASEIRELVKHITITKTQAKALAEKLEHIGIPTRYDPEKNTLALSLSSH
ncbi:hypothetical protein HY251_21080 [bacterium]|nr:hypothetical protein [bacterium]